LSVMPERVVVAMSGGVDSSVAAALLVEQGYEVIGVMLRLWSEPSRPALGFGMIEAATNRCCSLDSIHDARGVAEKLGIPFYVLNAEEAFEREVVRPFIATYAAGRTPNPCLICNRKIRFGYLLDYATRTLDARYLATGHYARTRCDADGRYQLWRGADRGKDQSYVLSVLGQADLAQALFPVGAYTKPQVRVLAAERGLPTASRVESQDLCFIADGDYRRFVVEYAPEAARPGPIVDTNGRQLGMHSGLPAYTIGQRSGLGVAAAQPLYVLELDMAHNALVVGPSAELGRSWLYAGPINWIMGEPPCGTFRAEAQIRYRATPMPASVTPLSDGTVETRFDVPLRDITPGQAVVFYQGEVCLGGGSIIRTRAGGEVPG
jgi:tRNA-uridine 2-sulfurtransferase